MQAIVGVPERSYAGDVVSRVQGCSQRCLRISHPRELDHALYAGFARQVGDQLGTYDWFRGTRYMCLDPALEPGIRFRCQGLPERPRGVAEDATASRPRPLVHRILDQFELGRLIDGMKPVSPFVRDTGGFIG